MITFSLRWWDQSETLLLWGSEQIDQERQRAEPERQRAEQAEGQLVQVARFRDGSLLSPGYDHSPSGDLPSSLNPVTQIGMNFYQKNPLESIP